jgi:hypothetical protein
MQTCEAPNAPRPLGDLSGPWILFVDNHIVAKLINVTRRFHYFEKYERHPVLTDGYLYGTVLPMQNGSGYRMWYTKYMGSNTYHIMYTTSENGTQWQQPTLVTPIESSDAEGPQVIDTLEDPRYKLICAFNTFDGTKYVGAYSSDGISWAYAKTNPILAWRDNDVSNFLYDLCNKRYIGYQKKFLEVYGENRRCVGFSATLDFEHWPYNNNGDHEPTMMLVPDYIDDNRVTHGDQRAEFYGFCGFAYESMYLGFLWIFQLRGAVDGHDDGPIFVELVTSHDGVNWRRTRQPIIWPDPSGGWDGGMVVTSNHPLVEGGTIKLFYGGFERTHGYEANSEGIGLATLRKDGFASLDTEGAGSVLTRKCRGMTGPLRINYSTNHGGWLRAEVLDASGNVIKGYSKDACDELKGDCVDAVVTWKHHTELPVADHPLQIRFVLQDASLYSFAAGNSVQVSSFDSGVLYTFEGDSGKRTVRNKVSDGEQDGWLLNNVAVVDDPNNAAFGSKSALKIDGNGNGVLQIPGTTNLGDTFTLSAMVKMTRIGRARIFSSYRGEGDPLPYEVVFDVEPSGPDFGLRAIIFQIQVRSGLVKIERNKYHHLAMTYDKGYVRLYFDSEEVHSGSVGQGVGRGGPVFSYFELRVGGDWGGGWTQCAGYVDDILVLPKALEARDIKVLCQKGAEYLVDATGLDH